MSDTYALILAGGSGTRFWPLSRNHRPKQLLDLFDNGTLINQTINRLEGLIPVERIFILTNAAQEEAIRKLCPEIPSDNIFAEPSKRDTAPAIALGIGLIAARAPQATMLVLPADQLICNVSEYHKVMKEALQVAKETSNLVTIGIKPTWPCPSFGYIERGETIKTWQHDCPYEVKKVVRFREKPNPELAEKFLQQGNFAWNAGMFIWTISAVTKALQEQCPALAEFIKRIGNSSNKKETIHSEFTSLPIISIDYALMEKAKEVLNIEATFDWDDVGSWISVSKYLDPASHNNQTNSPLVSLQSQGNIVFTQQKTKQVALLGVDDLIVVETEDSILIANRHQADNIKQLVDLVPKHLQ